MTIESTVGQPARAPADGGVQAAALEHCIVRRGDGIYADPAASAAMFQAAVDSIFTSSNYFAGVDYAALSNTIYKHGKPPARSGDLVRFASDIVAFEPARRGLYKAVKISEGQAEYYFEPVYLADPAGGEAKPTRLDADEFVADMWSKGIRFGIDMNLVRSVIAAGKAERIVVAQQLDPVPGVDAHIIEVSDDLHRSDAPRQLANGKLDLMAFQNRFPQIQKGARLLRKVPRAAGANGFDLSGRVLEPAMPKDLDFATLAGPGTAIEITAEGEFLVALQDGFLNVDGATSQVSVGDKIVSRDGVSAKTTGNLELKGDYEEFGEVQEKRVIEGEGIIVHADVYGNIVSRGGDVCLNSNLVGGSAHNAKGNITVKGVSSAAIIQASKGEVRLERAEGCVISGTRVFIQHAVNCEIIGDDVVVVQAEGCAIAARRVEIASAGARKNIEMLVFVLQPDSKRIDEVMGQIGARVADFEQLVAQRKAELQVLTGQPEVRQYMLLANRVRKGELVLTAEQAPQFQKMGAAVGPALKAIGKLSEDIKAKEAEQQAGAALLEQLGRQRIASAGVNSVRIGVLTGDTLVRTINYRPDDSSNYDLPPREIKARLRAGLQPGDQIFSGSEGSVDWNSGSAL
ncbi:MAG: flagellar assembly protein A [Telluria sp.]